MDVLSNDEFNTPYPNQGDMTFSNLIELLGEISTNFDILAIDICGGVLNKLSFQEKQKLFEIINFFCS